jgi:hypothetical protein
MRTIVTVSALCLLAAGGADARGKRGWAAGKKGLLLAQKLLERCKGLKLTEEAHELGEDVEEPEFEAMSDARLSSRNRGHVLEMKYSSWGSGVDAGGLTAFWRVDLRRGCSYVGLENRCCSTSDPGGWRFTAIKRGLPQRKEQLQLIALADFAAFDGKSAKFDAAAVQTHGRCTDKRPKRGWSLHGPILAPRKERRGQPTGSPSAIHLQKLKKRADEHVKGKVRSQTLATTSGVGRPKRSRIQGAFELLLTVRRGRLGGQGVVVRDTRRKRHRWVLDTGHCFSGAVSWLAGKGELLLGSTFPVHPVFQETYGISYFLLELSSGRAFQLRLAPGWDLSVTRKGAGLVLKAPDKKPSELTFAVLRARLNKLR